MCLSTHVTFVYASFYIAFAEEYDINIFEIIESRHFDRLQATSVIGEVHLLNLINELLLFLFIFFIFHIGIHGRKNKNCVAKTLFTSFTRRNFFTKYGRIFSLFLT